MAQLASKRYAKAMFELAIEKNLVDEYLETATSLVDIIQKNPDYMLLICNPLVSYDEKVAFTETIFKGKVSDDFFGLILLVFRKNREPELLEIFESLVAMFLEHKQIVQAHVFTPVTLSETQISNIKLKLSQKTNKHVEVLTTLQPDLLGGLRILVDGHIIDGSVKNQLEIMRKQLLATQQV